jgi:aconitate hydratase
VAAGAQYLWDDRSTYIKKPPYFEVLADPSQPVQDFAALRALAVLGDSVTTDHISPAGSIAVESAAGQYLISLGIQPKDFNSYGARRGNHEVMMRGTLANIRLRNQLAPGTEGSWTVHMPSGEKMWIYDAAMRYRQEGVGLLILAGKEYGSGSSRDWAAKGVALLGVKAVIAESFERIHRSNLVGMGVLPLEFLPGQNRETLGLTGAETFSVAGVGRAMDSSRRVTVCAERGDGVRKEFEVVVRVDTPREADYYRYGGILPYVLHQLAGTQN